MSDIILEKKKMRRQISKIKKQYSSEELLKKSNSVFYKIEEETFFKDANIIFCFWSFKKELNTHSFINKWFKEKTILLPSLSGSDIILKVFKGEESLVMPKEGFQILEPTGPEFYDYSKIDLVITPGVAFDNRGNRLGRGGGFYDRFFTKLSKDIRTIGVGYDFQLRDSIPYEDHDHKMWKVIVSS